jgi:hypothetical protein
MIYNKLVVPYYIPDPQVKDGEIKCELFAVNELEVPELKKISAKQYKQNHPAKWLANTISKCISEIGNIPVSKLFTENPNVYHPVILEMPMISTSNVLIAAHIESLGEKIEHIPVRCPNCPCDENIVDFDFTKMDFKALEMDSKYRIAVKVKDGIYLTPKAAEAAGIKPDTNFNNFEFRLSTVRDFLALEDEVSISEISDFQEKLMSRCCTKLTTNDGEEYPSELFKLHQERLLLTLKGKALKDIYTAHNKGLPTFELNTVKECKRCAYPIKFSFDNSFLFRLG